MRHIIARCSFGGVGSTDFIFYQSSEEVKTRDLK